MIKRIAIAGAFAAAFAGSAAAADWNVTEEGTSGIKTAQGVWNVTLAGDKVSGTATMQLQNGNPLTYKVEGTSAGGVYTIKMNDRTDGKKDCVWTGHAPTSGHGLIGDAQCEGSKMVLRVGL
jgi:hypothetical protein